MWRWNWNHSFAPAKKIYIMSCITLRIFSHLHISLFLHVHISRCKISEKPVVHVHPLYFACVYLSLFPKWLSYDENFTSQVMVKRSDDRTVVFELPKSFEMSSISFPYQTYCQQCVHMSLKLKVNKKIVNEGLFHFQVEISVWEIC